MRNGAEVRSHTGSARGVLHDVTRHRRDVHLLSIRPRILQERPQGSGRTTDGPLVHLRHAPLEIPASDLLSSPGGGYLRGELTRNLRLRLTIVGIYPRLGAAGAEPVGWPSVEHGQLHLVGGRGELEPRVGVLG